MHRHMAMRMAMAMAMPRPDSATSQTLCVCALARHSHNATPTTALAAMLYMLDGDGTQGKQTPCARQQSCASDARVKRNRASACRAKTHPSTRALPPANTAPS
jgi:hypothetical protein